MRMEFDKLSVGDPRLPREFNELNILSRRYIRLTYNKYDLDTRIPCPRAEEKFADNYEKRLRNFAGGITAKRNVG